MQVQIKANTIEVKNFLNSIKRRQSAVIKKALNRVSNMAVLMITKRTQSGRLPDGGTFLPYTKKTRELRQKKGRQTGHVDLTDTGKMFRSLDFRQRGFKNTLLFTNKEREKIAFRHDVLGVGKRKTKRPFFSIGNKEEDKIKEEFSKFYFSQLRI
jgi:hypothetical protein|tara:strand:- start:294 stop:758 length:465 start_codon:yes stop_codon:yes gene_type:complete